MNAEMLATAAGRAVVSGDTVLRQLVHGETQSDQEAAYFAGFRRLDQQPPPADDATMQSMRHRQIIVEETGTWRLKVPLMQQWLRSRG